MSGYEKNIKQVLKMDVREREILTEQLKSELKEFKERERLYNEKREELKDLEKKYRKKQDQILAYESGFQERIETNQLIIEHMLLEVKEHQERLQFQEDDNEQLEEKISTQRDTITLREREIEELQNQIQDRAEQGEDLRHCLDQLALEQKLLLEEQEQEKEELKNLKDIRDMREQEATDYGERLRRAKNEHFSAAEKLEQLNKLREQKENEDEEFLQEVDRYQNLIRQAQETNDSLKNEQEGLGDNLKQQNKEIDENVNQKQFEDEQIRRLQNSSKDLRGKIKDLELQIERILQEREEIRQNNEFREEENDNMRDELLALEQHLQVLNQQNKALEQELENFVRADEDIKLKLRSKSPPKVRFNEVSPHEMEKRNFKGSGFDPFQSQYGAPSGFKQTASTKFATSMKDDPASPFISGKSPNMFSGLNSIGQTNFKGSGFEEPLRRDGNERGFNMSNQKYNKENDHDESMDDLYRKRYNPVRDRSPSSPLRRDGGRIVKNQVQAERDYNMPSARGANKIQSPNTLQVYPQNKSNQMYPSNGTAQFRPDPDMQKQMYMNRQGSGNNLNQSRDYYPVRVQNASPSGQNSGNTLQPRFKENPQKGAFEIFGLSQNQCGNFSNNRFYNASYQMNQSNILSMSQKGHGLDQQMPSDFGMSGQTGKKKRKWSPLRGLLRRDYGEDDLDDDRRILY